MPMKRVYPDYFSRFQCVADRCRHNCCVGWEIDINPAALRKYDGMRGEMGDRLRASIARDENGAHFILDENERCPLLNQNGLCDLITAAGEKALCQICRDHPRFRAQLTDREEIGLGLCCEEACRLILNWNQPVQLIVEDDGRSKAVLGKREQAWLFQRERLLSVAQDRRMSIFDRMSRIMEADENAELPDLPFEKWVNVLLTLERMDKSWTILLKKRQNSRAFAAVDDRTQEQLLVYFLYRHYLKNQKQYPRGVTAFCVLSTQLITLLCEKPEDIYEVARLYSAEIEYSDENLDAIMGSLHEYNGGR